MRGHKSSKLHQIPAIRDGLEHLLAHDPVFRARQPDINSFAWPYMGPGFPALVRIIIGQQVSTAAAASLWNRFVDGIPCVTPNAILALKDEDMRKLGLSAQKSSYIRGLADAVKAGDFDPDALQKYSDEKVFEAITSLHGLGAWSAHMYLMFSLARPDVWAPGDLGIREGLRIYTKAAERPSPLLAETLGARFSPYRTAASLLLWRLKD